MQILRAAHQTEIIARVDPRDLVFVDESGCNRAMTRLYARSLRGTRARGTASAQLGRPHLEQTQEFLRKKAARTTETLYAAIAQGLQTLTADNAQSWFRHCGYMGLSK